MLSLNTLRRFLLAVVILDIPFVIDKHYGFDYDIAELNSLGGLGISLTTFCIIGLYGLWLADSAVRVIPSGLPRARVNPWLVLYVATVGISVLVATQRWLAGYEVFLLAQTFLLYFYIVKTIQTRADVMLIVTLLVVSMLFEAIVIIGLVPVGHDVSIGPISARVDAGMRIGGTAGSPNTAASLLSMMFASYLAILSMPVSRWQRAFAFGSVLAVGAAIVLTLSRGGWIAAILSSLLFCGFAWRRGWLTPRMSIVLAACALLTAVPFLPAIVDRVAGGEGSPVETRMTLMKLAYLIASDHPITGVGANNFATVMGTYTVYPYFADAWLHTVHNKYLLVLAENGIIGLTAFVGFLVSTVYCGWRVWQSGDRILAPLGLALALGVVGQMAHMNLDLFNSRPQIQLLWMVAALLTAMRMLAYETSVPSRLSAHS